jgi:hypothetical protein
MNSILNNTTIYILHLKIVTQKAGPTEILNINLIQICYKRYQTLKKMFKNSYVFNLKSWDEKCHSISPLLGPIKTTLCLLVDFKDENATNLLSQLSIDQTDYRCTLWIY